MVVECPEKIVSMGKRRVHRFVSDSETGTWVTEGRLEVLLGAEETQQAIASIELRAQHEQAELHHRLSQAEGQAAQVPPM